MQLKGYKEHFLVLNKQNNALSEELDFIIERDTQLCEEFNFLDHLKDIVNKNTALVNEIDKKDI